MSWAGWQDFEPTAAAVHEASRAKRQARIKGAIPTEVGGHLFPSKHEANRYEQLRLEEHVGGIEDLRLQVPFPLTVGHVFLGCYRADFTYTRNGHVVVEDAKGFRTEMFRWKRRHFEAEYGIRILET
jgi:hypothetical protein